VQLEVLNMYVDHSSERASIRPSTWCCVRDICAKQWWLSPNIH